MTAITHPTKPSEITTKWMNYAFSEGSICESGTITDIEVEPLGPHVKGLLSSICRVKITYKHQLQQLPKTVVVKFPPEVDERKSFGSNWGVYEREIMFYRELSKKSPIRVPKCYYTVIDESNNNFLLMIEDAGDWIPGDQVGGLSVKQTKSAVTSIGKFHAHWWESEELENLKWIPIENRSPLHAFHDNWDDFKNVHSDVLDKQDINAGDLIAKSGERIQELSMVGPRTIIHYDFRADNMMFNQLDEIMVVDWQTALISFGAFDVGRAVCGSHHGIIEKIHHVKFLELWYQVLMDHGVSNYTFEEAWRDYRIGIILSSYVPVAAHHFLSHEGSHGIFVLKAMIKRIFYALHECEVLELLT
ncbi:MAG: phosphotransferase [Thermodesulfobacteriota bacterium]